MARGQTQVTELSDFEKQRQANIAERDALLKKLTQEAQQAGLYTKPPSKGASTGASRPAKKKTPVKRKREEDIQPRRTSSRLAGITADSEVARRKAEQQYEAVQEAARAKRTRVSGDLAVGDIVVVGKSWSKDGNGFLGVDVLNKGVAKPYERTFGEDEIMETTDKGLKALREKMSGLELWDGWEPNRMFPWAGLRFTALNTNQASRSLLKESIPCHFTQQLSNHWSSLATNLVILVSLMRLRSHHRSRMSSTRTRKGSLSNQAASTTTLATLTPKIQMRMQRTT